MPQVISHTAIQEFKVGSAERGRSMFESCLRNYPARLDVWSQYLDQVTSLFLVVFGVISPFAPLQPTDSYSPKCTDVSTSCTLHDFENCSTGLSTSLTLTCSEKHAVSEASPQSNCAQLVLKSLDAILQNVYMSRQHAHSDVQTACMFTRSDSKHVEMLST